MMSLILLFSLLDIPTYRKFVTFLWKNILYYRRIQLGWIFYYYILISNLLNGLKRNALKIQLMHFFIASTFYAVGSCEK